MDKLPQTGDLVGAYAGYRKTLEQQMPTRQGQGGWWDHVQNQTIDGIWFMWKAEHDPTVFAKLQALQDVYSQKAAGG